MSELPGTEHWLATRWKQRFRRNQWNRLAFCRIGLCGRGVRGVPGLYPLGASGTPAPVVTTQRPPETHWFK